MPDLSARRWTRRSVLVLGAASAGLLLARTPAEGVPITVGELSFTVPDTIRPVRAPRARPGLAVARAG